MKNKSQRIVIGLIVTLSLFLFSGCGLTNERGNIKCVSAGVTVVEFQNAKVLYSDSDTQSAWIETSDGKRFFWQGDMLIELGR